jgi:phosphoribosylamine---glycine ligase
VKVLVIGSGGREHALAWGLARSSAVEELVAAPGNPGMAALGRCVPVDVENARAIAALADDVGADLTVVGPEVPLVAGAVDAIEARGRLAFGPPAAAARLEGSKSWMKEVLAAAGVPTARYRAFGAGEEEAALAFVGDLPGMYVVKTDGLAAGKGVVVTESLPEARDAVRSYLSGSAFGDAGRRIVIEEGLTGPEVSLLVLVSGRDLAPLAPAQDFKRALDGDLGPNTGGMGAYSPLPFVGEDVIERVLVESVVPTVAELESRGAPFRGVLYAGIMLTPHGPKILEYNVRFGDPETQAVIPRLASDLAEHCLDSARDARLSPIEFTDDACVTVGLATEGYPAAPRTGDPIAGIEDAEALPGVTVFHAGTKRVGDDVLTAGGRVLNVTAVGPTVTAARDRAYEAAALISWPGMQYRRDIARAVESG